MKNIARHSISLTCQVASQGLSSKKEDWVNQTQKQDTDKRGT